MVLLPVLDRSQSRQVSLDLLVRGFPPARQGHPPAVLALTKISHHPDGEECWEAWSLVVSRASSARQTRTQIIPRMAQWNPKNRSLPTGGGCAAFVVGEDPVLQGAELCTRGASTSSLLALQGVKSTFLRHVEVSTSLYQPLHYSSLPSILILSRIVLISAECGTKAFS